MKAIFSIKSKNRRLLLTAVIAVFLLFCALSWSRLSSPRIRLSFHSLTNDTNRGLSGVFRVENGLKESVQVAGITYEKASSSGWSHYINDFGPELGEAERLSAGASSTFRVWVPTNGGPYRLVLHCHPEGGVKPSLRFRSRIATLLFRMNVPKRVVDHFVYGVQFPTSLPFEVTSPNQTLEATADPPRS